MIFFQLTSFELGLVFFAVILGATGLGIFLGHRVRHLSESLKEPFGVLQAALLALVAFLLLVTTDLDRPTRGMIQVPDLSLIHI